MLLVCGATALTGACVASMAWVSACPTKADGPPHAPRQLPASKHFSGKVQFDLLAKLLADDRRSKAGSDWLRELVDPQAKFRVATEFHSLVGHAAPDFTLRDHRGQPWTLRRQCARGPVVLIFYLGYSCNACVHDLVELNADLERFHSLGAEVVAVSGDSPEYTRERFQQFGPLGFPVLSDPGHFVAQSFGMFLPQTTTRPESLLHGTFLISRNGGVHWASYGDVPFRNNKALLYEVALLENKLPAANPSLPTGGRESPTP